MSLKGNIFIFLMRLQRNLLYLFHCILLVYLIICLWTLKFQLISVLWPRLSRIWCCSSILSTHLKQILCLAILHTKVNYSETLLFISWLLCLHSEKDVLSVFWLCYRVTRLGDFQRVSLKYASGMIYINHKKYTIFLCSVCMDLNLPFSFKEVLSGHVVVVRVTWH